MPLVLFFSHGGWPTAIAAIVMLCFHFGILSSIPMGVPLEWNVFMMFSVLALFVGHASSGSSDLTSPLPIVLFVVVAGTVVLGNLFPRKVSFLPGMRYYAGNWDTTLWCMKPSAEAKIATRGRDREHAAARWRSSTAARKPRFRLHGIRVPRLQHPRPGDVHPGAPRHGRAARGRLRPDRRRADRSTAIGWNFGDGHMHNEQLIDALQERCHFEPGEVRVVLLDAQPIHRQPQEYRLVDAATGEFERGYVQWPTW